MSTGKKQPKTNKTAHVLNLLAGDSEGAMEGPGAERLGADMPPLYPKTAVSLDRADEQKIEEQIKSALEEAFWMEDLNETKKEGQRESSAPADLPDAPWTEPDEQAEAETAGQPEPELPFPQEASQPEREPDACPPATQAQEFSCVNVMQALVEEKVDKYIRLFGLCTCPRCRIDVKALTLTSLPAKYVVIGEQERIPMLSVYEGRYNAAVVSQVMWACKKVMDNPRHQL